MNYSYQYQLLNELFSKNEEACIIPDSQITIHNLEFNSIFYQQYSITGNADVNFRQEDAGIQENWNFTYPVFAYGKEKNDKAIVLLHGLNERNWSKYLTWAYYLAETTRRTVILFPLAFHMNRGKKDWSNPRSMTQLVHKRKDNYNDVVQLTFANAALSSRLTEDPNRFFRAGLQCSHDLVRLLEQIKSGDYPLLAKNAQVNFMGYSIGAFLTQIFFMANPRDLVQNSKAALFCGGTTFNHMLGTSRLIMDNLAYKNLNEYYLQHFGDTEIPGYENLSKTPLHKVIQSFKAMIPLPDFRKLKERALSKLAGKVTTIGLLKDQVMPAKSIAETLADQKGKLKLALRVEDFPYTYSHENPFPILKNGESKLVDQNFNRIFSQLAFALK
ncbi:hypothetical protein SAMN05444274_10280 [Mariniphaga anaerophila]|uniref:Alpha/beta hydrolase n=1 Tax=Mariniphaga anaerophila TaxID=1484053 RepID=A0A1M4VF32_9BACT|nr:DUF6051 family protein [Mariniphaga anaerophila]SHE67559.1 hypothetical protein SAMN05444274_10280 [Mariniphaga anaerophila]